MAVAKAGGIVRPADIDDTAGASTTTDTAIGSVPANFTITAQNGRTALDGKLVTVYLLINTTNAITATSGNTTDTTIFTLDAEYRPTEPINTVVGNGSTTGEALINTDGTVVVRAASDTIAAGTNIRVHATFLKA